MQMANNLVYASHLRVESAKTRIKGNRISFSDQNIFLTFLIIYQ